MQSSNKIKVFLVGKDNVGWSIDSDRKNTINLFSKSANFEITRNIFKADILYSVWYDILNISYLFYPLTILKKLIKFKIFAVITNNVEDTPKKIHRLKKLIDIWISPNSKTHTFIEKYGLKTIQIPFLIDKDIFLKLGKSKNDLAKILDIDQKKIQGRILIGSFQRDSLGSDLSKPKWQKDPDLLIEIMKKLPKEKFLLILAGPRRHYVINKCREFNIPCLFVGNENPINANYDDILENNLPPEKINLLYNLIDAYLVTSKSEGGPKAILECATTKTLIFSTDVGLAKDILTEDFIYNRENLTPLIQKIIEISGNNDQADSLKEYNYKKATHVMNSDDIIAQIQKAYKKTIC
ncbi:MAG: glycosyltransferase [Parcubacteria group bacterium]